MLLVSSCGCLRSIHWSRVLSWEGRCSWSSADRRCSNYIWVINNFIAYKGATYIRGFTVVTIMAVKVTYPSWKLNWSTRHLNIYLMSTNKMYNTFKNSPISQITRCIWQIFQNQCNIWEQKCAHFCYKMGHCGICATGLLYTWHDMVHALLHFVVIVEWFYTDPSDRGNQKTTSLPAKTLDKPRPNIN